MEERLTLVQHLEELRRRVIICLVAVSICGLISYLYVDEILLFLSRPVERLVFLRPTEAFVTRLKVAFYSGVFLAMPIIIYQIWRFVNPGLIEIERRNLYWAIPSSYILFVLGVVFALLGVLPPGMRFLLKFGTENIQPMISISSYISFVMIFLLAFGIIFQLPLIILLLTRLGIVTPRWLITNRKYAILIIFILAGILTPGPDIFSQSLMAIPTLILYELSIIISKLVSPFKKV